MIDEILFEGEKKMEKAVEVVKTEFGRLRTGQAQKQMYAHLTV